MGWAAVAALAGGGRKASDLDNGGLVWVGPLLWRHP